jgi:hypothetical protein
LINKWINELNTQFSKEKVQTINKYTNKHSASSVIKEMQIKTTPRFHLTPVRMAFTKEINSSECWQGCGREGAFLHCWWECKLVQPLWKSVWRILKKLALELPYDPAMPLLSIYLKERGQHTTEISAQSREPSQWPHCGISFGAQNR